MTSDFFLWVCLVTGIAGFVFGGLALYIAKDIAKGVGDEFRECWTRVSQAESGLEHVQNELVRFQRELDHRVEETLQRSVRPFVLRAMQEFYQNMTEREREADIVRRREMMSQMVHPDDLNQQVLNTMNEDSYTQQMMERIMRTDFSKMKVERDKAYKEMKAEQKAKRKTRMGWLRGRD